MATKGVQAELDALKRLRENDVLFEAKQRRLVTDQMIFWRRTARWLVTAITDPQILEEYERTVTEFNTTHGASQVEGYAPETGQPGDHEPNRATMGTQVNPRHPGRGTRVSARTYDVATTSLFGPTGEDGEAETSTAYSD
jgi:hypothetical protein